MDAVSLSFILLCVLALVTIVGGAIYVIVLEFRKAAAKVEFVYSVNDELVSAISRYIRSEMQIFYFKEKMRMEAIRQDPLKAVRYDFAELFKSASFDIDSYTELYSIIRPFEELVNDNELNSLEDFIQPDRMEDFERIKPFLSSEVSI